MEAIEIGLETRSEVGKSLLKGLRATGQVPGVVYSEGKEATNISLSAREFKKYVTGASHSQIFRFKSSDKNLDGQISLVKDMQIDPISESPIHVDFYALHEGHKITLSVPVNLIGFSLAVKQGSIILNQTIYELEVECLPSAIPSSLELDISSLDEGVSLHASDVKLPEGVKLKSDAKLSLVSALSKADIEEAPASKPSEATPAAAAAPAKK